MKTPDLFWEADLDAVEGSFLNGRKITDLKVSLDNRVPAQGRVLLDRVVNVDDAVAAHLSGREPPVAQPSMAHRLFNRWVFG